MSPTAKGDTCNSGSVKFEDVCRKELQYVEKRRRKKESCSDEIKKNLIGLALSGGGIRSATTNLGILQALSKMNILPMVDYLSTVSGGGYVGSCLSSLLSLSTDDVKSKDDDVKSKEPDRYEFTGKDDEYFTTEWNTFPFRDEKEKEGRASLTGEAQVKHLRTHGNFVMIRQGMLARETLRSIGNVLTGIVHNLFIVLLMLFSVSALYMGVVSPLKEDIEAVLPQLGAQIVTLGSLLWGQGWPLLMVVVAGGVIASLMTLGWMWWQAKQPPPSDGASIDPGDSTEDAFERGLLWRVGPFAVGVNLIVVAGVILGSALLPSEKTTSRIVWLLLPFVGFGGMWITASLVYLLWLPYGKMTPDKPFWSREFRSLWGSFQALTFYGSVTTMVLACFPFLVYAFSDHITEAGIGSILSLIGSRLLARRLPGATGATGRMPAALKNFVLGVVVGLFVLLVVFLFCTGLALSDMSWWKFLIVGASSLVVFGVLGYLVNSNKISPHYFYRDRLVETYLRTEVDDGTGRMQTQRDAMEMPLTHLHGMGPGSADSQTKFWGSTAPYHLINTAINLAGSRDLTRKDRKSGHFLFSKLFIGSEQTGYLPTELYRKGETKLARALTISGAAAGSAMGYHTFFAQAFITTVFNIRLGYWMENPRDSKSASRKEGGVFWPAYLLREMLLNTNARGRLVNLSDGGHTGDNVGIYPLLKRRCKFIVACDAEADGDLTFGSFTEALRHAYIDMGIEVDIDLSMLRPEPQTGYSRNHCAIGRIRYPDRPEQKSWIIYLKNSLTGDEPEPVMNYKRGHADFPHETTADQFFDDAQFESYRALGVHIAKHAFSEWTSTVDFEGLQAWHSPFATSQRAYDVHHEDQQWRCLQFVHSPFKAADEAAFGKTADAFIELERMFLGDAELHDYYDECYFGGESLRAPYIPKIRHICVMQTQLMEQVFFGLRLDRYANAPDNRGWMNLFRRWGNSSTYQAHFNDLRAIFSTAFVEFYDQYVKGCSSMEVDSIRHPWDHPRDDEQPPGPRQQKGIFLDPGRVV